MKTLRLLFATTLCISLFGGRIWSQEDADNDNEKKPATATVGTSDADNDETKKPPAKPVDQALVDKTTKAFNDKLDEWKSVLKRMRVIKDKFPLSNEAEAQELEQKWHEHLAEGRALIPQLRDLGITAYKAAPEQDFALKNFLMKVAQDGIQQDQFDAGLEVAQLLIENDTEIRGVYNTAGIAAFSTNQFAKANEFFKTAEKENALSRGGKIYMSQIPDYQKWWEEELAIREKEAEVDDLPRVSLLTSKGEIILELFENEAPQTVANFINLVESDFYDGLTFHRVLMNFMAQGGCPKGDGTGGPGYNVYCECDPKKHPNMRRHFRGTISMAHAGRNTGGSQFFITFTPKAGLNGQHTAFGRVIKGLEVLEEIQRRDPDDKKVKLAKPDRIVKAEVIRKRGHRYVPTKVED